MTEKKTDGKKKTKRKSHKKKVAIPGRAKKNEFEKVGWGMDGPNERTRKQEKADKALERANRMFRRAQDELTEMGVVLRTPKVDEPSGTGFDLYSTTAEAAKEIQRHADAARRSVQKAQLEALRAQSSALGGYEIGDEDALEQPSEITAAIAAAADLPSRWRRP